MHSSKHNGGKMLCFKNRSGSKNLKAFSLVELAITISIMGILVGTTLLSVSVMKNAKIRRLINEKEGYEVAISSFCSRYSGLPGDFNEASLYWSLANGNGNGQINFLASGVYEGYRAWQHLTQASMINGVYLGTQTTSAAALGTDVPESVVSAAGWLVDYGVFGFSNANILVLGAPRATTATPILVGGVMNATEAQKIDGKIDDGLPHKGNVHGRDGNGASANSCFDSSSNIYAISGSNNDCTLGFRIQTIDACTGN
jgi:hypothetical protein